MQGEGSLSVASTVEPAYIEPGETSWHLLIKTEVCRKWPSVGKKIYSNGELAFVHSKHKFIVNGAIMSWFDCTTFDHDVSSLVVYLLCVNVPFFLCTYVYIFTCKMNEIYCFLMICCCLSLHYLHIVNLESRLYHPIFNVFTRVEGFI